MRHLLETPDFWDSFILAALFVASICTAAFPLLYAFSPWYRSILGRAMMAQSIALALAMNLTLLFRFWQPTFPWGRLISGLIITLIAGTAAVLTGILWILNYKHRWKEEDDEFREPSGDDE